MSEKPKFTPGPWSVSGKNFAGSVLVSAGSPAKGLNGMVAQCDAGDYARDADEGYANAHLIAAAPDLYAALTRFVSSDAALAKFHTPNCVCDYCIAEAALAKAEGRS